MNRKAMMSDQLCCRNIRSAGFQTIPDKAEHPGIVADHDDGWMESVYVMREDDVAQRRVTVVLEGSYPARS